jgi:hypothetical protein
MRPLAFQSCMENEFKRISVSNNDLRNFFQLTVNSLLVMVIPSYPAMEMASPNIREFLDGLVNYFTD